MTIEEALKEAENWMFELQGVEGVAQGRLNDKDCITVFLSERETEPQLPKELHGYPISIEYSGKFTALE